MERRGGRRDMATERTLPTPEAPKENFSRGLFQVEIPELGPAMHGKVRDMWRVHGRTGNFRVIVTTDRQSAFDRIIGTVPGKGQVLNLTSAFWFDQTKDVIPNHVVAVPHPNVLIAQEAEETLSVEVVVRRYIAKSSTSTSIYYNYFELGRRRIYGIDFPEGLLPNQELPMGTIVTPTTKAEHGHDEELTDDQAREIVDKKFGDGIWDNAKNAAVTIFDRVHKFCAEKGLLLADTKDEFGRNHSKLLMLIDELKTPDSSRFWLKNSYLEGFESGQNPESFDKEILRRWLSEQGFRGDGEIPKVDPAVIDQMTEAYRVPYRMITGRDLPSTVHESNTQLAQEIRSQTLQSLRQLQLTV